jgi:pyruvate,water dikinase
MLLMKQDLVVNFNQVDKGDIAIVGGKGANLGEMVKAGFPVPEGFIVTAKAYYHLLEENNLRKPIGEILKDLDHHNPNNLNAASKRVKELILKTRVPNSLAIEIIKHYLKLGKGMPNSLVAVRSSATAEDLPDASFAGQQETYLNIKGEANLVQHVRKCWASLFEPRAIFYRAEKGFDHFKVGIAVPVQRMIQSTVSGIMFTVNPITNDKNQIVIEAIWGLGEKIVQGAYTPDHYLVQKQTWKLLQKQVNNQDKEFVLKGQSNKEVKVPKSRKDREKLSNDQIVELGKIGHNLQQHYFFPQDIEWAMERGKLYVVQSRPITTLRPESEDKKEIINTSALTLILKGEPASPGMATGYTRVLKSVKEIGKLQDREVLVTDMTTPDFVTAMKKASAIVTNKGGQTSHAAIVSRELGIPCIVGTGEATTKLKTGLVVTVNGKTGEVFKGGKPPQKHDKPIIKIEDQPPVFRAKPGQFKPDIVKTATKIFVNLGEPELASVVAQKNVDGVGLLRAEFMIAQGGIHPKKLIADGKSNQFINSLSDGLLKFAKAFSPRPVVYRATDFRTNEYANLIGGKPFEPEEENPMLGYRGAFRYLSDPKVFSLELEAIKRVRNKEGFKNLWLMIPFVRTVEQMAKVKRMVTDAGLIRSSQFQLWMMAEIPSNVVMLEEFINVGIDGVSIGSNDLTMLMLGVDRDSSEVAPIYNERDPAVLWAFKKIITTCHKRKITCSICGQAPSMYPDLTQQLVSWGISSVSVSPDAIEATRNLVYEAEKKLAHGKN